MRTHRSHHRALCVPFLFSLVACEFSTAGIEFVASDGGTAQSDATLTVPTAPTVLSTTPGDGAIDVPGNGIVSASFSEAMNSATLTTATFTLASGDPAVSVAGTVSYENSSVVFWPTGDLAGDGQFTATITAEAMSASGVALATAYTWSFTIETALSPGVPVNLRTSGSYVVLAKAAISGTTATVVGDLGVSPAAATLITGFSLSADPSNVFSTSAQVTGKVYAADYALPTPPNLTQAVSDMELACDAAAARDPDFVELGGGNIGGMTLVPGVYRWSSGVQIPTSVTLDGGATSVWIFQIARDLTMSSGTSIILTGGALAKNVFWQITGGPMTVGTMAHFEGVVLSRTAVTVQAGATLRGRVLAQTAVTIDGSTVVEPAP